MVKQFKAIQLRYEKEIFLNGICTLSTDDLSEGTVLIEVAYSSVNYKDMLAMSENGGVIRSYPMIPGIDISGVVSDSKDERFKNGDKVIACGYGIGVSHSGGYSEYARIPAEWLTHLPDNLSLRDAMIFGTAGFTAAMSLLALEKHGMNAALNQKVLVTGASGGVGSMALLLLKEKSYTHVVAGIRKEYQVEMVENLGADESVNFSSLNEKNPLLGKQIYDYILDTVGGDLIASLIPHLKYGGSASLCGNAGGNQFNTNVLPFILRNINVLGIDTVQVPIEERQKIWDYLGNVSHCLKKAQVQEIELKELSKTMDEIKSGKHLGRTIVKISSNKYKESK